LKTIFAHAAQVSSVCFHDKKIQEVHSAAKLGVYFGEGWPSAPSVQGLY